MAPRVSPRPTLWLRTGFGRAAGRGVATGATGVVGTLVDAAASATGTTPPTATLPV